MVEGNIFHAAVGRCLVVFQQAVVYCIGMVVEAPKFNAKRELFLEFSSFLLLLWLAVQVVALASDVSLAPLLISWRCPTLSKGPFPDVEYVMLER